MVADSTFLLNQVGHPPRRPQTGFVTQCFGPVLQPALDLLQVFGTQARFASSAPRFPQTGQPSCLQLLGPATDRHYIIKYSIGPANEPSSPWCKSGFLKKKDCVIHSGGS